MTTRLERRGPSEVPVDSALVDEPRAEVNAAGHALRERRRGREECDEDELGDARRT